MKVYLVCHICDDEPHIVDSYRSKEDAVKHVMAWFSFMNQGDISVSEHDNETRFYYKGEPKYAITEHNLNVMIKSNGSWVEVE